MFKLKILVHITIRPGTARHATPIVDTGGLFTSVDVYCFGAFIYIFTSADKLIHNHKLRNRGRHCVVQIKFNSP